MVESGAAGQGRPPWVEWGPKTAPFSRGSVAATAAIPLAEAAIPRSPIL